MLNDAEDTETTDATDEEREEMRSAVTDAALASTEIAGRMFKAFELWDTARERKRKEGKRTGELLAARIAQFTEAMQVSSNTTNDQLVKLQVVEVRWQELEDARDEKKLVSGACKDAIKAAEQKLKELLAEAKSNQLMLFKPTVGNTDGGGDE